VAVAGDMECATPTCGDAGTASLVSQIQPAVFVPVGDLIFDSTYASFVNFYDPVWGQFRSISHPAIGNHDGNVSYYDYWNGISSPSGVAGKRKEGWYSFNMGTWHFVVLNSNCVAGIGWVSCQPGSAQINWLNADLTANTAHCTIAFLHHPYYTSGLRQFPELKTVFQTLYNHKVELYVAGHTHFYQRFYPQDANGNRNNSNGVAEIVVGTGGGTLANVPSTATYKNQAAQIGKTFGVLKLVLHQDSYSLSFVPAAGFQAQDSASGICH